MIRFMDNPRARGGSGLDDHFRRAVGWKDLSEQQEDLVSLHCRVVVKYMSGFLGVSARSEAETQRWNSPGRILRSSRRLAHYVRGSVRLHSVTK